MTHSPARRGILAVVLFATPTLALAQHQNLSNPTPAAPSAAAAPPTQTIITPVAAATARRASTLIGANIINGENRNVGEVHDLMVDMAGGATIAVLSVGGFLGIGERYIAIPASDLRWNSDRERWMLPGATIDSLKARPAFTYPERT
jgi:sporulation protein YlmC with PRC-barrel domain